MDQAAIAITMIFRPCGAESEKYIRNSSNIGPYYPLNHQIYIIYDTIQYKLCWNTVSRSTLATEETANFRIAFLNIQTKRHIKNV